jgi:hypothetical protein
MDSVCRGGRDLLGRIAGKFHPALEVERISEMLGEIMTAAPGVESYSLETG